MSFIKELLKWGAVRGSRDPVTGGIAGLIGFPTPTYGSILAGAIGDSTVAGGAAYGQLTSADSIIVNTANIGTYKYPPAAIGFQQVGASSWFAMACLQSNGAMILNSNGGSGNDTSTGCLARLPDEIAKSPNIMFLQMGMVNDMNTGVSSATSKANMVAAIALCRASGVMPIMCTATPRNSNATYENLQRPWNEWIKAYGLRYRVPVVDLCVGVIDSASNVGNWVAAYSDDGTHPNAAGAAIMATNTLAQLVALRVVPAIPTASSFNRLASYTLATGTTDAGNLLKNPLFMYGATIATDWTMNGTGTASLDTTPGSGVIGNSQVISMTVGQKANLQQDYTITSGMYGQRFALSGLFKTSSMAANAIYSIGNLYCQGSNLGGNAGLSTIISRALYYCNGADFSNFTPFYTEIVIPSGTTSLQVILANFQANVGGSCSCEFAMVRLINLDAL